MLLIFDTGSGIPLTSNTGFGKTNTMHPHSSISAAALPPAIGEYDRCGSAPVLPSPLSRPSKTGKFNDWQCFRARIFPIT